MPMRLLSGVGVRMPALNAKSVSPRLVSCALTLCGNKRVRKIIRKKLVLNFIITSNDQVCGLNKSKNANPINNSIDWHFYPEPINLLNFMLLYNQFSTFRFSI